MGVPIHGSDKNRGIPLEDLEELRAHLEDLDLALKKIPQIKSDFSRITKTKKTSGTKMKYRVYKGKLRLYIRVRQAFSYITIRCRLPYQVLQTLTKEGYNFVWFRH